MLNNYFFDDAAQFNKFRFAKYKGSTASYYKAYSVGAYCAITAKFYNAITAK